MRLRSADPSRNQTFSYQKEILTHASELQDWMAAILNWHRGTRRHVETELRRSAPAMAAGPSGLGTRTARIRPPGAVTGT